MEKQILHYCTAARWPLALSVLAGLLALLATVGQMALLSWVVARVFLGHADLQQVGLALAALLLIIGLRAGLVWLREFSARRAGNRVKSEMRRRLFAHLLLLGPLFVRGERSGELVATLNEGCERLETYVARYLPQAVWSLVIPLLLLVIIWPLDHLSAILLLITGPVIPILMIAVGSYSQKHIQRQWTTLARLSAHFLDTIQGLVTLHLFGRSGAQEAHVARLSDEYRRRTLRVLRYAFLSGAVLEFMTMLAIGLIAVFLGVRLINRELPFEQAFLVLLLIPEFYRPLRELGTQYHAGMEGRVAAQRMLEILASVPPVREPREASRSLPAAPLTLTCEQVTYRYPDSERPALQQVSFTLPAGSCTALVGRSGAGKSTLVNLLLRFMEVESGAILVNGLPLDRLPADLWREYVALVPQRPYLFSGSVRDNIRLARPGASDEEVERAAELAGAADFIRELPAGYDTEVGEQGLRLSAGQLQRLALARAFLKQAPLLILDEPTSSLDPESEALLSEALARLRCQCTVLVIAHRLNTVATADQVLVLDGGRLIESGPPAALLQQPTSAYAQLMTARLQEAGAVPGKEAEAL
ncbi:thiol reductant ABC exporter subunit CydD [Thermogemmatispora aurantia]|jgi:ATP-binding cassette subfamily C protein CydD|uniref:Thiol reductant ABC exporter subunit CydD n=1 Tax=Thermogemmatispora aurantia TaxID=2045279 RepID=A0A5J4K9A7_9CHLR|nr:thiol reductant ABC exporter subunit CydD [Thermogemmatispora aurantia]GER85178.1 thiol reductant ABC exporter subunit CydD [Thermogemmatispora aurantia]